MHQYPRAHLLVTIDPGELSSLICSCRLEVLPITGCEASVVRFVAFYFRIFAATVCRFFALAVAIFVFVSAVDEIGAHSVRTLRQAIVSSRAQRGSIKGGEILVRLSGLLRARPCIDVLAVVATLVTKLALRSWVH